MAHVVNGKRKRKKQVIADSDPDNLHLVGCSGNSIKQRTCDSKHHTGNQNPWTGLALLRPGSVNNTTHNNVGNCINDLGYHRHQGQESACQAQNIRIELS